jgi:hypothetical protein
MYFQKTFYGERQRPVIRLKEIMSIPIGGNGKNQEVMLKILELLVTTTENIKKT